MRTVNQYNALARDINRLGTNDYVTALFTDFFEQRGDRLCREDPSVMGGIALFHGMPVTVIGTRKGKNLKERIHYNFGMPNPEGYRKARRLMKLAEKFGRPIITFIDTPGAFPGVEAEARGQGEAIAQNMMEMSMLKVPIVSVITGEGNSGGALGLAVADRVLMLSHSVYSVLSPEGFASILWRDTSRSGEAAALMKLTANDLMAGGIIDGVIQEPEGGAQAHPDQMYELLDQALVYLLQTLTAEPAEQLLEERYEKYRRIGTVMDDRTEKPER